MPYVTPETRSKLDDIVGGMALREVVANGDLNYILYAYCKRFIKPSYNNYKNFCGELRQCAIEIERRLLGPYEDTKIEENGDVL